MVDQVRYLFFYLIMQERLSILRCSGDIGKNRPRLKTHPYFLR